jgi:hypothetical protein
VAAGTTSTPRSCATQAPRPPPSWPGPAAAAAHHNRAAAHRPRAAARDAHYDGKWPLRTCDLTLTAEDLAAAYKQLLAVERGWRDCKTSLGLRPVYHHREDRIRAHVQLCWLAMLLIRVVETRTGDTGRNLRHELDRMHLVTLATGACDAAGVDHGRAEHRAGDVELRGVAGAQFCGPPRGQAATGVSPQPHRSRR